MHVITRKRLNEFAKIHPDTKNALAQWYQLVKANKFSSFAELRQIFPSADQVGKLTVFNPLSALHFVIREYFHNFIFYCLIKHRFYPSF
jgi:mRNA-degrading endonuclease HigB of HigAB toxin-antitoxin module